MFRKYTLNFDPHKIRFAGDVVADINRTILLFAIKKTNIIYAVGGICFHEGTNVLPIVILRACFCEFVHNVFDLRDVFAFRACL